MVTKNMTIRYNTCKFSQIKNKTQKTCDAATIPHQAPRSTI